MIHPFASTSPTRPRRRRLTRAVMEATFANALDRPDSPARETDLGDTRRAEGCRISVHRTAERANLLLLMQLRWLAIAGQVSAISLAHFALGVALPLRPMGAVLLGLVALNLVDLVRYRRQDTITNTALFVELLLDVAALTVQLYLSGGETNPFISLFLLQVILGAVLLEAWSSWTVVAVTSGCYLGLTVSYRAITLPHDPFGSFFNLHVHGMFICFLLAAVLLVFFVNRINRNLRRREAALAGLAQQSIEEDHIVRMGLLASGAAHQLGTPLSTLSILLNDWERIPALNADPELAHDLGEMQAQVRRCKHIVSKILLSAGEARGEGTVRTTVNTFLDDAVEEWRVSRTAPALEYRNAFGEDEAIVSDAALRQIIFNVFDNALEASPDWVGIFAERQADRLVIRVDDRGPGFDRQVLAELGQPYRSTKGRAGGGLGLFLVFSVVRKLGGTIKAGNRAARGAMVELALPLAALCPRGDHAS